MIKQFQKSTHQQLSRLTFFTTFKALKFNMKSFINYPSESDFSIYNIPFGVAVFDREYIACCTRIGDQVVDLATLYDFGYFDEIEGLTENVFEAYTLNEFIELGKSVTNVVRIRIQELLLENSTLSSDEKTIQECFYDLDHVKMMMPVHVQNYTDFYSSIEHATNVGKMFRDPENALLPNWRHLPVGYHGRASSIVVSGTEIIRPKGQQKPKDAPAPILDRLSNWILNWSWRSSSIKIPKWAKVFQLLKPKMLFSDWFYLMIGLPETSKVGNMFRWGPFLGKNFASSVSPWVVTLEALNPFRVPSPKQEPEVLDYLKYEGDKNFDINLEVYLQPHKGTEKKICHSNFKYMYWNMAQQLAHHTSNGCNIEVGDMYASGTISGKEPDSYGSMLELTWRGENPIILNDGQKRQFLENYDKITMKGWAAKGDMRVGFGEVIGTILPSN